MTVKAKGRITSVIATHGRWPDVARLATHLRVELQCAPIVINDGGPLPPKELADQIEASATLVNLPENIGNARAIHEGVRRAETDFIMIIDSDDFVTFGNGWADYQQAMDPSSLHVPRNLLIRNKLRRREASLSYLRDVRHNKIGTHSGMILSVAMYDRLGGYDPALISCKDWDFWVSAYRQKVTLDYFPATLVYATENTGISRDLWRVYRGRMQLWDKHPDIFAARDRAVDWFKLLKYAAANCSLATSNSLRRSKSATFMAFSLAHAAARISYLLVKPLIAH